MCLEKVHRLMMATVIGIGTYLIATGVAEGIYVLYFVIAMLVVFGFTDFCLSVTIMKKLGLKSCNK